MAAIIELRDPAVTRQYILAGLWLSRIGSPNAEALPAILEQLFFLAGEGHPAPPAGFVADVGWLALGSHDCQLPLPARELSAIDAGLIRRYEDYVLGKLYSDLAFERAYDALARYQPADRSRGLAYLLHRLQVQTGSGGAILNPAAIRSLQKQPADELLAESWQLLTAEGLSPSAQQQYEELIESVKNTGDLLAPADIFELEHGTALVEFGQRLALRQVLQAADSLAERVPRQRPRGFNRQRHVATRLLEEDAYPIGGFSSISTKGSVESLLHSQLAYLERDALPDLFDIKYVRDELLYYSRDENQFLRRHTTFVVLLSPDLVHARIKDATLPYQRIIVLLGLLLALVRILNEWWTDEALALHFIFLTAGASQPLSDEQSLLELLLAESIEQGAATVEALPAAKIPAVLAQHARRSLVHVLLASATASSPPLDLQAATRVIVRGPRPEIVYDGQPVPCEDADDWTSWHNALLTLLLHLR